MTAQNLFCLAKKGLIGQSPSFEGYCVSAAIDACFDIQDVPVAVYSANIAAFAKGELGREGKATDRFNELLGSLAFRDSSEVDFVPLPYYFASLKEFQTDLAELRNKKTILLDVNDGLHSVGLKPVGDNAAEWQIVGTHQIVAAASKGKRLDVQCMTEPEIMTTEQVWNYLLANNLPGAEQQTAIVFPAEPA